MKWTRSFSLGLSLSLSTVPAWAALGGTALSGAAVPDWAVGNARCSGTLITPRVVVTSQQCVVDSQWTGTHHRKTDWSYGGLAVWGVPHIGPIGDVGLILLSAPFDEVEPVALAAVPSYRDEQALLSDPGPAPDGQPDDRAQGTALAVYAADGVSKDFKHGARRLTAYLNRAGGRAPYPDATPLTYRSLAWLRRHEPWWMGPQTGLFAPGLYARIYTAPVSAGGLQFSDAEADAQLIAFSGEDPAQAIVSPINEADGDRGGGLFAIDAAGTEWLVGTVSGARLQTRLSAHWPWVFRTLLQHGLRADAIDLARSVLGTGAWAAQDPYATEGDIYLGEHPVSGQIEFFRLIRRDGDGGYGAFPIDQRDNAWWAFLGTRLPDRRQVIQGMKATGAPSGTAAIAATATTTPPTGTPTAAEATPHRPLDGRPAPGGPLGPFSPLPGSAPALPAPGAAR
ncbi:hypothetical protein [Roseateles amylovorans]|uniref:Peptidase S1 domain-containing protein n=1 Tax=Roseateles amylovorans TaxID=2978473 RepID=A0ABY6B0C4_9BURK|nr:hypothetical protein [Roseateles amylovorans]UXH78013.1 hypothetical protein N4261_24150 [Roseateles amylovorans]